MKTLTRTLSVVALMIMTSQSFAFNIMQGRLIAQLGGYFGHQGTAQDINIQTLVGDRFTVSKNNGGNVLVGLGYYFTGMCQPNYTVSYGVNAFYLAQAQVKGDIDQEHLFTNLAYRYNVSNVPVYAAAKIDILTNSPFAITLDGGIGPNFVITSNYKDHSLDGITLPDNAFTGQTNAAFSATVGIGVKLSNNIMGYAYPVECGYRFFYLGQGYLKKNNSQVVNRLKTGNDYANALVCAVTF